MLTWVIRARDTAYLGSMIGLSYTLDDLTVTAPELSGFIPRDPVPPAFEIYITQTATIGLTIVAP